MTDSSKVQPTMVRHEGRNGMVEGQWNCSLKSVKIKNQTEGTEGTHLSFFFLLATPVFRPIGWCHPPQVSLEPRLEKHPKHASLRPKAFLKSQVDNTN